MKKFPAGDASPAGKVVKNHYYLSDSFYHIIIKTNKWDGTISLFPSAAAVFQTFFALRRGFGRDSASVSPLFYAKWQRIHLHFC